jgi:hypothetical protein
MRCQQSAFVIMVDKEENKRNLGLCYNLYHICDIYFLTLMVIPNIDEFCTNFLVFRDTLKLTLNFQNCLYR